jgi:pyruvate dehydrogenase E2 component (dihydrolipoamide acetyltransferase)
MAYTMYMPKLGMTMERGTINRWFKQEGEWVEKDEPLLEVETDKVGLEVEAPVAGRLARILAPAGATLEVMAPIAELVAEDVALAPQPATAPATNDVEPEAVETSGRPDAHRPEPIAVPAGTPPPASPPSLGGKGAGGLGSAGRLADNGPFRAPAAYAAGDQLPPAVAKIPATPAAKREAQERGISLEDVAAFMKPPLTRMDVLAFAAAQSRRAGVAAGAGAVAGAPGSQGPGYGTGEAPHERPAGAPALTPLARKMAAEAGLAEADVAALAADAPAQKITREHLAGYLESRPEAGAPALPGDVLHEAPAAPPADQSGEHSRHPTTPTPVSPFPKGKGAGGLGPETGDLIPLTTMRRVIGERMASSFATAPHIYLDLEVDMSEAERLRARRSERGGPAIAPTALLVKVAGVCLARYPQVNASFAPGALDGQDAIHRYRGAHVGVAVAVADGLLVPVVRDADRRDLADIAATLADLTARARAGKLRPDDLEGGTFSISNLGMYGIDTFHAIINPPQSAILAIGRITRRPIVVGSGADERIEVRPLLKLSLSADHRVVDGAAGAQFLAAIKELLEEPYLLL